MTSQQPVSYNVLLIEEDPKQTELYSTLIREVAPCKVDVMSRVDSSFEWIAHSNYHLVVIDLARKSAQAEERRKAETLPTISPAGGLAVLEQIKRMSPMTSVILISDKATVEQAVAAIRLGAEDYFKKPFKLENFQLSVRRGLDRKKIYGEDTGVSNFLTLLNSCQMISASLDQKKIFSIVQSYLSGEVKSRHSAIYRLENGSGARVETLASDGADSAMEEIIEIALHASGVMPKMAEANEFYRFVDRGQLTPGLFIFRFRCAEAVDHFCVCLSPVRPAALTAFESRIRLLKSQIEVTSRNIEQYRGVEHLVYVDDATGLYNTRYLNQILDREIAQSQATRRPFAVLFIDIDRFKSVNDTYGHLVGTKILNELGTHLKKFVRDTDTVFRYGGDEFVAVLSACDLHTAQTVAERIRHSVEDREFLANDEQNLKFTVSIGVALYPDHAGSKKAIIDAADQAMYSAKRSTRNLVTIASIRGDGESGGGSGASDGSGTQDGSGTSDVEEGTGG